jgi:hypothetical protein
VHLPQHQLEGPVHQVVHLFGVEGFRDGSEPGDVSEQDRHLLAFAGKRCPVGENLFDKVLRGIG